MESKHNKLDHDIDNLADAESVEDYNSGDDASDSGSEDEEEILNSLGIECAHTLEGHAGQVLCAIPLSNNLIASGGCYIDKTIRLWDVNTGEELERMTGFTSACLKLLQLDEHTICSGHADGVINVWDIGAHRATSEAAAAAAAASADLAVGGEGKTGAESKGASKSSNAAARGGARLRHELAGHWRHKAPIVAM